ncbi:ABC transporter ATP-binding protein [Cryobacterium sp. TMT1-21]|uniref:ABC transporter ATP-binding protein n=1 Tax=Cryobacterium shii TaxID=1259235 RepID=A0AAQ2C5V2_9MICO|nr:MULTISPECIES: ABC transporter ATP-binding protein [Cryobacterium]TFC46633.1 ABC transporter ATP-binding protein [Cryobacterium shii]TFC89122.1 ABC transporter ATP-binding protein [Cryobacterium sp. TmT2-59]TFD14077.1 ABC transporter ATP-binding protein [Cryobacterium sp. TMT4-10]TFD17651.1 ABC transporter ATP-binding protein [Cryobacterium sp. TMT1-21]TFD22672.1 ABC transporter ATP-binding protein [Cryobacterium sp. TMT2-23]
MTLIVSGLDAGYGKLAVLHQVSFEVARGEIVAVVGSNGAGKTTLLRAVSGQIRPTAGSVTLEGRTITGKPSEKMAGFGLTHVPENRLCFPTLSVRDNLMLGAWTKKGNGDVESILDLFPRLRTRMGQAAGTLSGGEQQMVAIGRGLMADPTAIMLDEPSIGLAPKVVAEIMEVLSRLCVEKQLAVLLVEQNVRASFKIAHRAVVMHRGRVALTGTPAELVELPEVHNAYLGGAAA